MTLTTQQKTALKANILADGTLAGSVAAQDWDAVAAVYNAAASPAFTVWKSMVTWTQIGDKINSTELVGLTTGKLTQLQTFALIAPGGISPANSDRRDALDQIFSASSGTITRPALLALYKRLALRIEKVFATGTGTDPVPATLGVEGTVTSQNISDAMGGL